MSAHTEAPPSMPKRAKDAGPRMFPRLLSPLRIGDVDLCNRVVSPPHGTRMARDAVVSDELIAYHEERALGGVGLIVFEYVVVDRDDALAPSTVAGFRPEVVPSYRRLADALHAHGTKVFAQLHHRGGQRVVGVPRPPAVAPSAVPTGGRFFAEPRALRAGEIDAILDGYAVSARHAAAGGLDGVEISLSHNYLAAQFMAPRLNRRTDRWSAGPAFPRAIIERVREAAPSLAVGVRFSADSEDARRVAPAIAELCDFLSLALGDSMSLATGLRINPPPPLPTGMIERYAAPFRCGPPVIAASRIADPVTAERLLAGGAIDAVGMARALITDAELVAKAAAGRSDEIVRCIGCTVCSAPSVSGTPLRCAQNPRAGRERSLPRPARVSRASHVVVVGAGPAGLACAAEAAQAGLRVTLLEQRSELGGQLALAARAATQAETARVLVENALAAIEHALGRVELRTGTTADAATVSACAPDAVVLASGAAPWRPPHLAGVGTAWDVLDGRPPKAEHVVVLDWGGDPSGLASAELLAASGHRVTVALAGVRAAEHATWFGRGIYLQRLYRAGVRLLHHVELDALEPLSLRNVFTRRRVVSFVDAAPVLALGRVPRAGLAAELRATGLDVTVVGDAAGPRTLEEATLEGLRAARRIAQIRATGANRRRGR